MPTIDPNSIPTVQPGDLFDTLASDPLYAIRWFVAKDPVYFSVMNRPIADEAVRNLIVAKALDTVSTELGSNTLFPFLEQCQVDAGTFNVDFPLSLIYDMHVSIPQKWEKLRLIRVKRMSGLNDSAPDGILRLVFAAQLTGSSTEVVLFTVDYRIDSSDTYQIVRIVSPTITATEPIIVDSGEFNTIDGFIIFKSLNYTTDSIYTTFIDSMAPPIGGSTGTSPTDGIYTTPTTYDVTESVINATITHGTGLLVQKAWNCIPDLAATINSWVEAFNYPFADGANTTSSTHPSVIIPTDLFKEFQIAAPAGDKPTGDTSGNYFPVYLSRITRDNPASDQMTMYFATLNVESPTTVPVDFAKLILTRTSTAGTIIKIEPVDHLFPSKSADPLFTQGFGKGHVVLSTKWGSSSEITAFFDSLLTIIDVVPQAFFLEESTRLSSFATCRIPQYTPTKGQAQALLGTSTTAPSSTNKFVVEADQGVGTQVDFANHASIPAASRGNVDIDRYGYSGALAHRVVKLIVNAAGTVHDYTTDVLPRLTVLFGRAPAFGDQWWDGTRLKFFNGDNWVG